jgi:NADH-quinone oxidoreductase subunit A
MTPYGSLLLYIAASVGLVGLIVGLNAWLGPRPVAPPAAKLDPFECGVAPQQRDNVRPMSIKYYPIAIFFLLFDLETVLLFIWASAFDQKDLGTLLLGSFLAFMALLGFAFAYLWRDGGFDWR